MGTDSKTRDIHREIKQRIYDRLLESMVHLFSDKGTRASGIDYTQGNIMQFMNWLADERNEIRLLNFRVPQIQIASEDNGAPIMELNKNYIDERKQALRGELLKIASEFSLTLDEARAHVADFNRTIKTQRQPMIKAQEA